MPKKFSVVLIVVTVVLIGLSSVVDVIAQVEQNLDVTMGVEKFVEMTILSEPMGFGNFTGEKDKERFANHTIIRVETNTPLDLRFSGDDLSTTTASSSLETSYWVNGVDFPSEVEDYFNRDKDNDYNEVGNLVLPKAQQGCTSIRYEFIGFARTGETIASQEAGQYTATITMTVSFAE